jgi:L-ascorbate metabolism protein UlaG (beta-lactamase superfamily)
VIAALGLAGCQAQSSDQPAETSLSGDKVIAIQNAGATAELGEGESGVKFLFDPLYDDHFGSFAEPDEAIVAAIISGAPPYDGVDAVFVSHAHGDHFSASKLTRMMVAQDTVSLVAPKQAIDRMRELDEWDAAFEERVVAIDIDNGAAARSFEIGGAIIEAIRSPHTGWPKRHANVHNITFRVAAPDGARVMHFGDADPSAPHFAPHAEFFASARTGLAIVPFWYFGVADPDSLIDQTFNAEAAVGMHVAVDEPEFLAKSGRDYFNKPGQEVAVPVAD